MDTRMDTRKLLAELVGTFVFFLIGLMSILSTKAFPGGPDLVVIAFGFGLGLFAAIQIAGAVSGGHFNPAVTLAAVLDKRLDPITGVGYVAAQLIGGIAAAAFVLVMSNQAAVAGTITGHPASVSDLQAVVIEAVFTAIFIAVILTVTKKDPGHAAFVIPADPRRDPPGPRADHRLVGQSGALACLGPDRRRPDLDLGLHRGPARRGGWRLGGLSRPPRQARRGLTPSRG